jgi:hypothetical protein
VKARSTTQAFYKICDSSPGTFNAAMFARKAMMFSPKAMDKNMKLLPVGTILCPTDFSESSIMVLQNAVELALRFDAELCLRDAEGA